MTKEEKIKLFQEAETTDCVDCTKCIFKDDASKCVSYSAMNFVYEKARQEVAQEIFNDLDKFIVTKVIDHGTINYDITDKYVALKNKYTKNYGEYLTIDDVRNMSPKEVKENYWWIVESMKRW